MSYHRIISNEFVADLKQGILSSLLARVKEDDTLMLALRGGYINIYYRGGNLLKIEKKENYKASFDTNYCRGDFPVPIQLPDFTSSIPISNKHDADKLVDAVPALKHAMDRYFVTQKHKPEREFQQLVARENNSSTISNETEYFIVDIEVAGVLPHARFDMLAVRWMRNERKKQGSLVPVLIEMKYGSKALKGTSGLDAHFNDADALLNDKEQWEDLRKGMEEQVNQLDELGLLNFNRSASVKRLVIDPEARPELIFLFANYNPASENLANILNTLDAQVATDKKGYNILFSTSCFSGYGMHRACMLHLPEFKAMVEKLYLKSRERIADIPAQ